MSIDRVDFIVFAPLNEEVDALKNAFKVTGEATVMDDGSECYQVKIGTLSGSTTTLLIVQLYHMGVLGAAVMATKLIARLKPWCIVSFGIAGGFVKEDIGKRDVFIPDVVFYYEPAKESVRNVDLSGSPKHQSESRVRAFFPSKELEVICRRVKARAQREFSLRCKIGGPLASGEKKVADLDGPTVTRVREIHSKTLAIEMEAAGVAAAVDGWPELFGRCHFLAVKGISDDASETEDLVRDAERLETRRFAALNAAHFLRCVIEEAEPEYIDDLPEIKHQELRRLSALFVTSLPGYLTTAPLDDVELRRVLHPYDVLPPLIYHWRLRSEGVHWVDFAHLLALNRIQHRVAQFPIELLVTDLEASEAQRGNTQELISKMFGDRARITWYQDISNHRPEYVRHAFARGFDEAATHAIRQARHRLGLRVGNLIDEEWLQYIIWLIRNQDCDRPRAIVFAWHQNAAIYQQLLNALGQDYLIVPGRDFTLHGTLGKFDSPGRFLVIDPPEYSSLLNWLEVETDEERVIDMAAYLVPLDAETAEIGASDLLGKLTRRHYPRLSRLLAQAPSTAQESLRSLLVSMLSWNANWFVQGEVH